MNPLTYDRYPRESRPSSPLPDKCCSDNPVALDVLTPGHLPQVLAVHPLASDASGMSSAIWIFPWGYSPLNLYSPSNLPVNSERVL
jgi:hypothetical protein